MIERTPPTRRASHRQELSIAKDLGGRPMPASGALSAAKDDHRCVGLVRTEAKTTASGRYRFDPRDFVGLRRRAVSAGEIPLFQVDLHSGQTRLAITDEPMGSGISGVVDTEANKTFLLSVALAAGWTAQWGHEFVMELNASAINFPLFIMRYDTFKERLLGHQT